MRTVRAAGLAGAFLCFAAVGFSFAGAPDARAVQCGANVPGNRLRAAFAVPAANRVWEHVPAMARAPELEVDGRPAFVAIFEGTYAGLIFGTNGMQRSERERVVCIVTADGFVNVYSDVELAGLRVP